MQREIALKVITDKQYILKIIHFYWESIVIVLCHTSYEYIICCIWDRLFIYSNNAPYYTPDFLRSRVYNINYLGDLLNQLKRPRVGHWVKLMFLTAPKNEIFSILTFLVVWTTNFVEKTLMLTDFNKQVKKHLIPWLRP